MSRREAHLRAFLELPNSFEILPATCADSFSVTICGRHRDPGHSNMEFHMTNYPVTHYRTATVDGIKIFYREAGPKGAPVVLLLHGFPTSSHMFPT